jgi:hypothetical protein
LREWEKGWNLETLSGTFGLPPLDEVDDLKTVLDDVLDRWAHVFEA